MRETGTKKAQSEINEMREEYDFTGGIRGKHYKAMQEGYTITIHREDGTTLVKEVHPKGVIILEPDLREYFPDSETVNRTLRSLITLIPMRKTATTKRTRGVSRRKSAS